MKGESLEVETGGEERTGDVFVGWHREGEIDSSAADFFKDYDAAARDRVGERLHREEIHAVFAVSPEPEYDVEEGDAEEEEVRKSGAQGFRSRHRCEYCG